MTTQSWKIDTTRMAYLRFGPDESLVAGLEQFALANGIREAAITSCIGSLRQLNLRNLCSYEDGSPEFERTTIDENLELVSAEGYIQPCPIPNPASASTSTSQPHAPSGEMVGGHCEETTTFTGAFMYIHILDEG